MAELPKLSGVTKILATPEVQFEKAVKEATKVELPPGPASVLFSIQEAFEKGKTPELPAFKALKVEEIVARLPKVPPIHEVVERMGEGASTEGAGYRLRK